MPPENSRHNISMSKGKNWEGPLGGMRQVHPHDPPMQLSNKLLWQYFINKLSIVLMYVQLYTILLKWWNSHKITDIIVYL